MWRECQTVPILINFRESVPIPINRSVAEIGAVQVSLNEKKIKTWAEIGAVLVDHLRDLRQGQGLRRLRGFGKRANAVFFEDPVGMVGRLRDAEGEFSQVLFEI